MSQSDRLIKIQLKIFARFIVILWGFVFHFQRTRISKIVSQCFSTNDKETEETKGKKKINTYKIYTMRMMLERVFVFQSFELHE